MTYAQLAALPAEAYLNPENFRSSFDCLLKSDEYARKQYATGLEYGRKAAKITIGVRSVWSAKMLDGASVSSYEGIGYHTCTADLLRGFIDSGTNIEVWRDVDGTVQNWLIQSRKE